MEKRERGGGDGRRELGENARENEKEEPREDGGKGGGGREWE